MLHNLAKSGAKHKKCLIKLFSVPLSGLFLIERSEMFKKNWKREYDYDNFYPPHKQELFSLQVCPTKTKATKKNSRKRKK